MHDRPGRVTTSMESRLRIAGQAVQPVLVMFPLGLFAMAVLFDLANLLGAPAILGALAYWNIVAGLIGGVLAAVAGAIDLMLMRNGTAAKPVGVLQNLANMGVLILFAVILMLRMSTPDRVAGGGLFAVEMLALAGAVFGAWYGGEIVNRRPAYAAARSDASIGNSIF
ncbi:DUF2231 domain-containing protein [Actinoplanes sp. NPDC051494]|uniref:DUF2231 domain-containing protein n=1 Tax=Actinoplanes sp. NPDC051494 TaxID=3363907 RepID=UPI003792358B